MSYEDKDVKTVEALGKIKAILVEYDLLAALTVVSQERVHWMYHFDPSWSCLYMDTATGEARIRAIQADFATPEQHKKVINSTISAIACTRDMGAKQFGDATIMYDMLAKQFKITHTYSDRQIKHHHSVPPFPKKEDGKV